MCLSLDDTHYSEDFDMGWDTTSKLISEAEVSLFFVKGSGVGAFLIVFILLILIFRSRPSAMERIVVQVARAFNRAE